jgi:hypothetical protein
MENLSVPAHKNPNSGDDAPSVNITSGCLPPEFVNDSLTPPQAAEERSPAPCSVDDLLARDELLGATLIQPLRSNKISL